jgi:ABC-2 type transport system permease protein
MKALDIALKDLTRSFRTVFAVGMMFVAPLLITGLIYLAFGGLMGGEEGAAPDLPRTRVVVVNDDAPVEGLAAGEMLVTFLQGDTLAALVDLGLVGDEEAARALLDRREADMLLLIPRDFSEAVVAPGARTSLILIPDPTLSVGPAIVREIISQFVDNFSGSKIARDVASTQLPDAAARAAIVNEYVAGAQSQGEATGRGDAAVVTRPPVADEARPQENPLREMMGHVMAGMLIFFAFFTGAYTAQSILYEAEMGTLARLFTTPTSRTTILAGKLISVVVMVAVQAVVLLLSSGLLFGIRWGKPLPVAMVTFGLIVVASGFGILLMSFVRTTRQAGAVTGGVLTALGMLGGLFTVAVPNVPETFLTATLATPQGWALRGWQQALDHAPPGEVVLPVLVMVLIGAACFAAGSMLFRRRFA